MLLYVNHLIM